MICKPKQERWQLEGDDAVGKDLAEFIITSDAVLRLSLLTLVYRAVPHPPGSRTTFRPECIQAARATLERHQRCMTVVAKSKFSLFSIYMHWTILFAPFVPFIVLFCQVIETRDRTDLARLQGFVVSIQSSNTREGGVSEPVDRLCRLFQVLYSVASHYVESYYASGAQSSGEYHPGGMGGGGTALAQSDMYQGVPIASTALTGIDSYLAALGFPPPNINPLNTSGSPTVGMDGGSSANLPYHTATSQGHGGGHPNEDSDQQQQQYGMKSGDDGDGDADFQLDDGHGPGQEPQRALDPMIWMGNEAQLEGWLYSNQQMLSFLEDGVLDTLGGLVSSGNGNGGHHGHGT